MAYKFHTEFADAHVTSPYRYYISVTLIHETKIICAIGMLLFCIFPKDRFNESCMLFKDYHYTTVRDVVLHGASVAFTA